MEDKYHPQKLGQKEYNMLGTTVSLLLWMCIPIFGSGKAVVLDSQLFLPQVLQSMKPKVCMQKL